MACVFVSYVLLLVVKRGNNCLSTVGSGCVEVGGGVGWGGSGGSRVSSSGGGGGGEDDGDGGGSSTPVTGSRGCSLSGQSGHTLEEVVD
eukprot:CAMPEP_0173241254 /NCGR_PEP_ID=MMETSP1142-20121109/14276_1 /TAXON_ID=483371 /ORGANISM="non described non described, Strain CCMP2298" /LENGTH=88 /DNA_ID=CAMNT_0014172579 /DNA_START=303 /DNA_END=565 /DNA_ORIENTATION=+